jgi:2-methylcitrate dehydratase PrpD
MDGDTRTARFISETNWDSLPPAVRKKAGMCFMDNLAAVISGTRTEVSRIGKEFAAACCPGDESTVILHGVKSSAAGAAFANGCAANGLDTDDGARYAYGHAGAQIFPTALALSEAGGWKKSSGGSLNLSWGAG